MEPRGRPQASDRGNDGVPCTLVCPDKELKL